MQASTQPVPLSYKPKHINKLSFKAINHPPPSTTCNIKSKSKPKSNDQQYKATGSNMVIVDLPSTFTPPSKITKPKTQISLHPSVWQ
jgi:hypothetical protein